jgi:hypothetical protein
VKLEASAPPKPNAKRQTPSAKRQAPNAKRQTPNAERRTPNAKRQTPNAERRTPTPQPYRAPSLSEIGAPSVPEFFCEVRGAGQRFVGVSIPLPPFFLRRCCFAVPRFGPGAAGSPAVGCEIESVSPGRSQTFRLVGGPVLRPSKPCLRSGHRVRPNAQILRRSPGAGARDYRGAERGPDRIRSFNWCHSINELISVNYFLAFLAMLYSTYLLPFLRLSCLLSESPYQPFYTQLINHYATSF